MSSAVTNNALKRPHLTKESVLRYAPLIVLVIIIAIMGLTVEYFLTSRNVINILRQASALGIMSIGMTAVLVTGGMDLSIPSMMAFGGILGSMYMRDGGDPIVAALIMVGTCMAIGAINGFAVARLNMIPFVVTLSMMYVMEGAAVWVTDKVSVSGLDQGFIDFVMAKVWIIPVPVIILAIMAALAWVIFHRSYFGRWLYATGVNARAARVSGVPTKSITFAAYVFSGFCAGVAAIIITARLASASAVMGQSGIVLDIMASSVVGGVSIYGGSGSPVGAAIGAILITLISNSMNMLHIDYYVTLVVKGLVIILVVALDTLRKRGA